jgi:hypothetical protein
MIVSHKHRFIFLKPRKVAGSSFEIALSKYMTENDIVTPIEGVDDELRHSLGFCGPSNHKYAPFDIIANTTIGEKLDAIRKRRIPLKYNTHMPAKMCKRRLGEDIWNSYAKISIVRNPWDMALSRFYFNSDPPADLSHFTRFCVLERHLFAINHTNYFIDGKLVIDHFLRFEHFEHDIKQLSATIGNLDGLWDTFKMINAKGHTRPPSTQNLAEIYAAHPDVDALIRSLCRFEIEHFGYELDA